METQEGEVLEKDVIDRVHNLELWQAELRGANSVRFQFQEDHNKKVDGELQRLCSMIDEKFGKVFAKLTSLEVKVAMFAAIAGLLGTAAAKYLLP